MPSLRSLSLNRLFSARPEMGNVGIWTRREAENSKKFAFQFTSKTKSMWCASYFNSKWACMARPFSWKPAGNEVIGIYLGATNSRVAVMDGNTPKVIENKEGSRITPSVVAFSQNGELLVGTPAKFQAVINPTNTIWCTKHLIGRRFDDLEMPKLMKMTPYKIVRGLNGDAWVEANGRIYSPSDISAFIISNLKETAEAYVGKSIYKAVITVPVYFNGAQRQATEKAGHIAGLEVKSIIDEPRAVALSRGTLNNKNGLIALFDLGVGPTFHVSILRVFDSFVEAKATNDDALNCEEDFDSAIVNFLVSEFKRTESIDLSTDWLALCRLRDAAEKAKIELSCTCQVEIILPFITSDASGKKHLNITLTRSMFETIINHLIERIRDLCTKCLEEAGVSTNDIDGLFLIGGNTKIPKVQEVVSEVFGRTPHKDVDPDEAVAIGAAFQGSILKGGAMEVPLFDVKHLFHGTKTARIIFPKLINRYKFWEVTPLSLGIETTGGLFNRFINQYTNLPTKMSKVFTTTADNQTRMVLKVVQGENVMAANNKLLGEFELVGIPPAPRGSVHIEVTLDIDENGIITISAKDKASGEEQQVTILFHGYLSEEEIDRMVQEAEYSITVQERKNLVKAKIEAAIGGVQGDSDGEDDLARGDEIEEVEM